MSEAIGKFAAETRQRRCCSWDEEPAPSPTGSDTHSREAGPRVDGAFVRDVNRGQVFVPFQGWRRQKCSRVPYFRAATPARSPNRHGPDLLQKKRAAKVASIEWAR